jgi:hypothetical protein
MNMDTDMDMDMDKDMDTDMDTWIRTNMDADIRIQRHTVKPAMKLASRANFIIMSRYKGPYVYYSVTGPVANSGIMLNTTTVQSVSIIQQSWIFCETSAPSHRSTVPCGTVQCA